MLWRAYTTESVMNEPGLVTISMNELQRVKIIEADRRAAADAVARG
jgi:hypothetical protein